MKVLDLDKLPASQNYSSVNEFLSVNDDELWQACKEWERRVKKTKDSWDDQCKEFGLRKELIAQVADEVVMRNAEWLAEKLDRRNPMALLGRLYEAPRDKPAQVLRLLRLHRFKRVELVVWVVADNFLSKWVERKSQELVKAVMDKLGFGV